MKPDRKSGPSRLISLILGLNTDWLVIPATLAVFIASLIPRVQAAALSPFNDQIQHIGVYGVLALLAGWRRQSVRTALLTGLAIVAFSAAIEFIQPSFGRDGEARDLVANCIGVGFGFALMCVAKWMRRLARFSET